MIATVSLAFRQSHPSHSSPARSGQPQMIDDLHPTAPTPGEHETTAAISDRLNQSANLRIKKQFSDRDRHRFLDEGLEYIARYFEDALKELEVRNPQVDTRFKLFDANRFEAMVYANPEEQSRCGIWLGAL